MTQITFTISGTPIPWQRAGRNGKKSHDTHRNISAKKAVAWEARAAMGSHKPFKGPIKVRLVFMYSWPVSYTEKRKQMCWGNMKDTKPDADNLEKLVLDALNKICYEDDSQVCTVEKTKFFTSQEPCTRVMVEALWGQG